MSDHDPMCPISGLGYEADYYCFCKQLRERDARVRADERERMRVQVIDESCTCCGCDHLIDLLGGESDE